MSEARQRKSAKGTWWLFFLVCGVLLPFVWPDLETREMDKDARLSASGEFLRLRDGVVHYELSGPKKGPLVVLVHGFTTPFFVWDPTQKALVRAGYRVLRFDLFGRGYSDRPDTKYSLELYERQLIGLLDALHFEGPFSLVGLSMGGAISAHVASKHPSRIRRLALLAPAGVPTRSGALAKVAQLPLVGEYLIRVLGTNILLRGAYRSFSSRAPSPDFMKQFRYQMGFHGYRRAILSSLRYVPLQWMKGTYETIQKQPYPVMIFWGKRDRVIPFESHRYLKDWLPRAKIQAIDGVGHQPHREAPHRVHPALVRFLR